LIIFVLIVPVAAYAQTPEVEGVSWQQGPSTGNLENEAEIYVPEGYVFAGANSAQILMEKMQNPTSGTELGFLAPGDLAWWVLFEFNDDGYIKDDEKGSLDPDAMLKSIKAATEVSNNVRKKRGWPIMTIQGWEQQPHYDEKTHNLEWGIRGQSSEGDLTINYNTRLLGRRGVVVVTLVSDPKTFSLNLEKFKTMLAGFDFKHGLKYADYRQGDKVAKYGLTALVVGAGAAAAAKTGIFKVLWKFLAVGFIAILAFLKSLFSRNKSE